MIELLHVRRLLHEAMSNQVVVFLPGASALQLHYQLMKIAYLCNTSLKSSMTIKLEWLTGDGALGGMGEACPALRSSLSLSPQTI